MRIQWECFCFTNRATLEGERVGTTPFATVAITSSSHGFGCSGFPWGRVCVGGAGGAKMKQGTFWGQPDVTKEQVGCAGVASTEHVWPIAFDSLKTWTFDFKIFREYYLCLIC